MFPKKGNYSVSFSNLHCRCEGQPYAISLKNLVKCATGGLQQEGESSASDILIIASTGKGTNFGKLEPITVN